MYVSRIPKFIRKLQKALIGIVLIAIEPGIIPGWDGGTRV